MLVTHDVNKAIQSMNNMVERGMLDEQIVLSYLDSYRVVDEVDNGILYHIIYDKNSTTLLLNCFKALMNEAYISFQSAKNLLDMTNTKGRTIFDGLLDSSNLDDRLLGYAVHKYFENAVNFQLYDIEHNKRDGDTMLQNFVKSSDSEVLVDIAFDFLANRQIITALTSDRYWLHKNKEGLTAYDMIRNAGNLSLLASATLLQKFVKPEHDFFKDKQLLLTKTLDNLVGKVNELLDPCFTGNFSKVTLLVGDIAKIHSFYEDVLKEPVLPKVSTEPLRPDNIHISALEQLEHSDKMLTLYPEVSHYAKTLEGLKERLHQKHSS